MLLEARAFGRSRSARVIMSNSFAAAAAAGYRHTIERKSRGDFARKTNVTRNLVTTYTTYNRVMGGRGGGPETLVRNKRAGRRRNVAD
jgi:hypothetical protein